MHPDSKEVGGDWSVRFVVEQRHTREAELK